MVVLRSGKDVPFLGKNIPKRNQKRTLENSQDNRPENAQQLNSSSIIGENSQESLAAEAYQNTSRSSVSSTDSIERSILADEESSMLSGSDQSTMIDDTLEITDLGNSSNMDESNQSSTHLRRPKEYRDYEAASKCTNSINHDAMIQRQSNMCGVADLSWF